MSAADTSLPRRGIEGILPIVDAGGAVRTEDVLRAAQLALDAGASVIQLRAKSLDARPLLELARELSARAHACGARLFVNDRPDVALLAGADGVHLGQTDLPATEVRRWLPAHLAIGVSCHDEDQVARAVADGVADYLGYGPIFPTRTKADPDPVVGLEGLARVTRRFPGVSFVAIGGITTERLPELRAAGARGAAMIAGLFAGLDLARDHDRAHLVQRIRDARRTFGEPRP